MARSVSPGAAAQKRREEERKRLRVEQETARKVRLEVAAVRGGPASQHEMSTRSRTQTPVAPTRLDFLALTLDDLESRFPFIVLIGKEKFGEFAKAYKMYMNDVAKAINESEKLIRKDFGIVKGDELTDHQFKLVESLETIKTHIVWLRLAKEYPGLCLVDHSEIPLLISTLKNHSITKNDSPLSDTTFGEDSMRSEILNERLKELRTQFKARLSGMINRFPSIDSIRKSNIHELMSFDQKLLAYIVSGHKKQIEFWYDGELELKRLLKSIDKADEWLNNQTTLARQLFATHRGNFEKNYPFIESISPDSFPHLINEIRQLRDLYNNIENAIMTLSSTSGSEEQVLEFDLEANSSIHFNQSENVKHNFSERWNMDGSVAIFSNKELLVKTASKELLKHGIQPRVSIVFDQIDAIDSGSEVGEESVSDALRLLSQESSIYCVLITFNWRNSDSPALKRLIQKAVETSAFEKPVVLRIRDSKTTITDSSQQQIKYYNILNDAVKEVAKVCSMSAVDQKTVISSGTSHPTSPVLTQKDVAYWKTSFKSLLQNKVGCALFRQFLKKDFSDENLEFWLECEEFNKMKDEKKTRQKAIEIYSEYVAEHAPKEVNLNSFTRAATLEAVEAGCKPDSFFLAQICVEQLMSKDSYRRFLRDRLFLDLLESYDEKEDKTSSSKDRN